MSVIEKFNGLHGAVVSRPELESLLQSAKQANDAAIVYRLSKVLNDYPDTENFELEVRQYPETGLNGPQHSGTYKKALDSCGRLRPGYKFENGRVVKVVKKKKAKAKPQAKPEPKPQPVKTKPVKKDKPVPEPVKQNDFVLPGLPSKYEKAIYTSSVNELKRYADQSKPPLSTAAANMLYLVENHFFELQNFKEGYFRDSKSPEYRNVPAVWQKLTAKDLQKLDTKQLSFLLDKLKEYQYETAWNEYSFHGKNVFEINKIVKANIRLIENRLKTKPTKKEPAKEPEGFANKPVSTSISKAIKDVLSLDKYKKLSEREALILWKYYKDEDFDKEIELTSPYEKGVLKDNNPFYYVSRYENDAELWLYGTGDQFIKAVKNRVESLKNQKHNYALFDGLAGPAKPTRKKKPAKPKGLNAPAPETIEVTAPEVVKVPAAVKDNPSVLTSDQLMNMEFETLELDGPWADFMQEPAKNMKIAIWGKPKNGKTSGAAALANYLTKFGNVLYNFVDQGFNKSTQDIWRNSGNADNPKAFAGNAQTLDELDKIIASGDFDFVFIDMINDYINKEKIKPAEFKERFIQKYPDVSFILVMEVTKSGDFKGDQGWTHLVDAIVTVENFVMDNRGRYGMGQYVVWPEGLQKLDPKRYEELFADQETESEPVPASAPNLSFSVI